MIKLTKKHDSKHKPKEEWRRIIIDYTLESYRLNSRVYASDIDRLVSRKRIAEIFGDFKTLIAESGLPSDAMYGSHDCDYCGIRFVKNDVSSRFCCKEHQQKSHSRRSRGLTGKKNELSRCKHCYGAFEQGDVIRKYCSDSCRSKEMSRRGNKKRRALKSGGCHISYSLDQIIDRDGGNCAHCGVETSDKCSPVADHKRNIDHIIPLSRGGHDAIYNCQILCRRCNLKKGSKISSGDYSRASELWPNPLDIAELRKAKELKKNCKSGFRGVFFDENKCAWFSDIEKNGKRVRIKSESKESAIAIRKLMRSLLASGVPITDIKERVKNATA